MENKNKDLKEFEDKDLEDIDLETIDLDENDLDTEESGHKKKHRFSPHLFLLAIILLIGIIAGYKLIRWNMGEEIVIDPTQDTSMFDTETEDYIMVMDPTLLEGHPDDGVTTILSLGNAPFSSEKGKNGIASQVSELTGATVYNAAFNNTYMSCKNSIFDETYSNDAFSLYWLTKAITLNDYTLMDNHLESFSAEDPDAPATLDLLKSIDMEKVDILTIMYDAQDYLDVRITLSPYDEADIGTTSGALLQSLDMIKKAYPHIRIFVLSPTFACALDENGEPQLGSTYRTQVGLLSDYMSASKVIAVDQAVSFIDHYFGTVTESNYKEYLEDNIQLNDKGRTLVAKRIAEAIKQ